MSDKKRKVPKLRFPGFTDDWEQRKLGEVGSTFTGLSGKSKDDFGHGNAKYVTYLNVLQNPVGSITQLDNIEIDEKQNAVKQGDVFFTTSSETPDEVGMSSVWKYDIPNIYLNSFTFGYRPNQEFDLDYLAYMLRSDSVRQKIKLLAQGISRFNISKTKMMEISIPIASDKEQTEIGKLFANVEALLSLHQRKLDNVKMLKKSLLQKLFPKDGEKIPELRFPGFTDDWEQRKLIDEVISIDTGKSKFTSKESGVYEILGSTSVIGYDDSYDYEGNFLLTARVGANAGTLYRHSGKVKISDNTVFIQGEQLDFLYYALLHFDIKRLSFGTGQPLVKASELKEQDIMMPVENLERMTIGTFFSNFVHLISLHQRTPSSC